MTVSRDEVERVAQLAALGVSEDELPVLTEQIGRILEFVAQLERVAADADLKAFRPGRAQAPLRDDAIGSLPLARPLDAIAPETREGFVVVPKLGALGDE